MAPRERNINSTGKSRSGAHLLTATVRRRDDKCTFANPEFTLAVNEGQVLWLQGPSGAGKTLTCLHVLGIQDAPGVEADVTWEDSVPHAERCGMLFQQGVLIDSINVQDNIALSLQAAGVTPSKDAIKEILSAVGIKDMHLHKMPNELSGGMLRRVALAQLLAQRKRVVVLDEPFIGLDVDTATGIARELKRLKEDRKMSFILISHQERYVSLLEPDVQVHITPKTDAATAQTTPLGNLGLVRRIASKTIDYLFFSCPLIFFASLAAGFAITMLFADVLNRTDVSDGIMKIVDEEMGGRQAEENPMMQMIAPMLRDKIQSVIKVRGPELKAVLYTHGIAKLFVLELAPLLTALLLAGRIGGSYVGEIGTMIAALLAGPILTAMSAAVAVTTGAMVAAWYNICTTKKYWKDVHDASVGEALSPWQTYPPAVLLYRSLAFIVIIMLVAEASVITTAVVVAGLAIICADWGFSQVLLQYYNK